MTVLGTHTYEEIKTQPEAWQDALDTVKINRLDLPPLFKDCEQVIFTGCGSTYYLSLAAAALFQELTGISARAVPGGDLLLYPKNTFTKQKTTLVAVSRSGSTSETVKVVERYRQQKQGPILVVTNYGDQPLAELADVALVIAKGQESSVAQTRSFASMYVATTAMTAWVANQDQLADSMQSLTEAGEKMIQKYEPGARELGENLAYDRFYFLGSGPRYGLACETNLKMKEMTLTHSEPFHFLEFRHGPMSMVTHTTIVAGFLSDSNRQHEQKVLDEMSELGATVIGLGEMNAAIQFQSGLAETVRNVLYLPFLQMLAYYRSMAKGLNPDQPSHLSAVVKLNFD